MTHPTVRGPLADSLGSRPGFKNSLRKIPSSLFRNDDNSRREKDKTAKRKGLASLLGWGRETPPPVPPLPVISEPKPVGAKPGTTTWTLADVKRTTTSSASASSTDVPSAPSRQGWARSLRTASGTSADRTVPEHRTRPSCPPDPFERPEGVRVVNRAHPTYERAPHVKAIEAERRTFSPNITTVSIDNHDIDDRSDGSNDDNDIDESWVEGLSNFDVANISLEFDPNRSVEVPRCGSGQSSKPQPRSNEPLTRAEERPSSRLGSLGRALDVKLDPIRETPEPERSNALKREKTKSRVWGMLTGKSRKSPTESTFPRSDTPRSATPNTLARPVPVLRVTKPSTDFAPPSPLKIQTNPSLKPIAPPVAADQTHRASRSLPRRKSLSGLFGISLKKSKSSDKLRSRRGTPNSSPKKKAVGTIKASPKRVASPKRRVIKANRPAPPPPVPAVPAVTGNLEFMGTPLRGGDLFTVDNDTSPDTTAFYSRFGNMGFNAEGDHTHADVTLSDTSSANAQLSRFLASLGPSLSPVPLHKMRSAALPPAIKRSAPANESASTSSSPGLARGSRRDASPSPPSGRRTPVMDLVKGMRARFSIAPPSPSPPSRNRLTQVRADSDNEIKPRRNDAPSAPAAPVLRVSDSEGEMTLANTSLGSVKNLPVPTGGLPPPPPSDRRVDRLAQRRQQGVPNLVVPQEDFLAEQEGDQPRGSFDFTQEVLGLDRGDGRTSFIKALHKALSKEELGSPLKDYSPSSVKNKTPQTTKSVRRRSPARFEGEAAFQKFVEQTRKSPSPAPTSPPRWALPPLPSPTLEPQPHHKRQESVMSFASISSLGIPLGGSSLTHDFTNYFENNYTGIDDKPPHLPPLGSMPQYGDGTSVTGHQHRRSESAGSIASLAGAEISYVSGSIRSIRPSYLTRHKREGSVDSISSTLGRPDWRSHRRISSSASSVVSVVHISRPTVGERMFERDQGVKLDSFHEGESRSWSMSSFASYNASGEADEAGAPDSVFGHSTDNNMDKKFGNFLIKSRPLSGLSTSSSNGPDDTFDGVTKAIQEVQQELAALGPAGKPVLPPVAPTRAVRHRPAPLNLADTTVGDTSLPVARGRAARHRPAPLALEDYSMDTPGLDTAYTSADDSSVFSWDAHMSQPPTSSLSTSFSTFFPPLPTAHSHVHTHTRNHSSMTSAVIHVEPTIPEENSQATLRGVEPPSPIIPERDNFNFWDHDSVVPESVTAEWLRWQREAEEICHQNKHVWLNSPMTEEEMTHFRQPSTTLEIEQFLAESKAKYKPLEQLPLGHVMHRRKVSLTRSNSRVAASPYGVRVPPLESRFRNKKSSSEASDCGRPVSALLLEFAREQAPQRQRKKSRAAPKSVSKPTPRSVPRSAKKLASHPSESDTECRQPITNSARRRNLGWGRRRPVSEDSEPGTQISPFQLSLDDELNGISRPVQRFRHEKQPSFIIFSPYHDDENSGDESGHESPSPLPRASSPALMSRPAAPRRRALDVKVNSMGSPVNVAAELEPLPLAARKPGNRLSYEPGSSPLRMRPLQSTSAATVRPAPAKSRPVIKPLAKPPKPARPGLRSSAASQPALKVLETASSSRLNPPNSASDAYTALPPRRTRPKAGASSSKAAHPRTQPLQQQQQRPLYV